MFFSCLLCLCVLFLFNEQVSTYKYLGVTIDEKLHWSDHINNIKSKAIKRLYFVRKLGQFKEDRILINLFYKSVIESILSFCITCWGGTSSKGDRIKVDRIIKISEKYTTHVPYLDELYDKKTLNKKNICLKRCKIRCIVFLINLSLTVLMGTVILWKKQSNTLDLLCHLPYDF